jgi:integrase
MFNLAATEFEMREGLNPATGIERNPETKRERYLEPEELGRLLSAVSEHKNKQSANVIKLALLTGARRGEILGATWSQFDLAAGTWTKPASMTKQKKSHMVPLNGPALSLLVEMKEAADEENRKRAKDELPALIHLFPGYGGNDAQGDLKRTWTTVCAEAHISGLRFHDLRHSFASFLVSSGHNLPLIGQLLGHSNPQTTARYAHLLMDPQRQATDRIGSIFTSAAARPATVESFPKRRA